MAERPFHVPGAQLAGRVLQDRFPADAGGQLRGLPGQVVGEGPLDVIVPVRGQRRVRPPVLQVGLPGREGHRQPVQRGAEHRADRLLDRQAGQAAQLQRQPPVDQDEIPDPARMPRRPRPRRSRPWNDPPPGRPPRRRDPARPSGHRRARPSRTDRLPCCAPGHADPAPAASRRHPADRPAPRSSCASRSGHGQRGQQPGRCPTGQREASPPAPGHRRPGMPRSSLPAWACSRTSMPPAGRMSNGGPAVTCWQDLHEPAGNLIHVTRSGDIR